MKPEEAIKRIDKALSYNPGMTDKDWEAFHVMEDATEKRIAKKPDLRVNERGLVSECSECSSYIGYLHKHCHECGQAQDWRVEK